jgi:hypothetical protein
MEVKTAQKKGGSKLFKKPLCKWRKVIFYHQGEKRGTILCESFGDT